MYDVDLLVPTARAGDAVALLDRLGWLPEQDQTAAWVRWRAIDRRHGWGFTRGDGHLDLHWHVLESATGSRADDRFWAHARTVTIAGSTARVLDPAHLLLHVLAHGRGTLNAPAVQWIADAVTILRAHGDDRTFLDRFADEARTQDLLAVAHDALTTIGDVLTPEIARAPAAALDARRPTFTSRVTDLPQGGEPLRQLGRRARGGTGMLRGAAAIAQERLDLRLANRPAAATMYALMLRPHAFARLLRGQGGSFVRVPAGPVTPLAGGAVLDFTDPVVLDRHGAVGWGRTEAGGATTRGAEPRLVLPLAPDLGDTDLRLELTLEARSTPQRVVVVANETPVARLDATLVGGTHVVRVPAAVAGRFTPLELAFRGARRPFGGSVRLRLRTLVVTPA